ncbi:MAG: hypothetical protein IAC08_09355 [Bacteroidetes bacterium]|uniref:Uncharacterized protein n=1 Tax=Candidatus Cryptobacteroides intestinigallinarum TaxID=2840767 RepID=A0A9D9N1D4_9BACT|nr:hypothetical protein [Candidatus Cryptobacteroides intestinigallinarum]
MLILTTVLLVSGFSAFGQDDFTVRGRILDMIAQKPFAPAEVRIMTFESPEKAEAARKSIENGEYVFPLRDFIPESNGYYETAIPEGGAILVTITGVDGVFQENVRGRERIDFNIIPNLIDIGVVTADAGSDKLIDMTKTGVINGNTVSPLYYGIVPKQFSRPNTRFILQPVVYDEATNDTLALLKPVVFDGSEYHLTQDRMLGFEASTRDPLDKYVDTLKSMDDSLVFFYWSENVKLKDPDKHIYIKGGVAITDYNVTLYQDTVLMMSARVRRPMRFLDMSFADYSLDPEKYRETPRRELYKEGGNISMTFLVNSARLDEKDSTNAISMKKLQDDLLSVVRSEGSKLTEFHIKGISSPDGSYASNKRLSVRRMDYALSVIASVLPAKVRDNLFMTKSAEVATWGAVADLLEADSLETEAAAIREIVDKYPGEHDVQGRYIRRLPFYKKTVTAYLPKLRSVEYEYNYEIFRALTPGEILDRYENDENYRSGKSEFELYEFWHLFQLVKDEDELDSLYQRAYDFSNRKYGKPWALAANNLAQSKIRHGIADTTLLLPLIDKSLGKVNVSRLSADGSSYEIINPDAVVANQIIMYLMAGAYDRTDSLMAILPERYGELKAAVLCFKGYYGEGDEESEKNFSIMADSSPRNRVVMYLARDTKKYNELAKEAVENLPPEDALTEYLKAIISCRYYTENFKDPIMSMYYEDEAIAHLLNAIHKDPEYLEIAEYDGDIPDELFKRFENTLEEKQSSDDI